MDKILEAGTRAAFSLTPVITRKSSGLMIIIMGLAVIVLMSLKSRQEILNARKKDQE